MLRDMMTTRGLVATTPRHTVTSTGATITSFRMACQQEVYSAERGELVSGDTNWYTVVAFGDLATNASESLEKGQRVIVTGALTVTDWASGDNSGYTIEITATTIGHDLSYGVAKFKRSPYRETQVPTPKKATEHVALV
jgi:single-strand DNA-binding protein